MGLGGIEDWGYLIKGHFGSLAPGGQGRGAPGCCCSRMQNQRADNQLRDETVFVPLWEPRFINDVLSV